MKTFPNQSLGAGFQPAVEGGILPPGWNHQNLGRGQTRPETSGQPNPFPPGWRPVSTVVRTAAATGVFLLAVLFLCTAAQAQSSYSLRWGYVASGGGQGATNSYTLSGAVGLAGFSIINNGYTNVVTSTYDSGPGSLRDTVATALPGDFINFAAGLSGQTITLTNGQITVAKGLTIDASTLINRITISGNNASRVLEVLPDTTVTLDSLIISDGKTEDGTDSSSGFGLNGKNGGGILNSGSLLVRNCVVSSNSTGVGANRYSNGAGAGGFGGGIFNQGTLVIENSSIANNRTGNGGGSGGIGGAGGLGGGIYSVGSLTIDNSIFSNNTTGNGGEGHGGGGVAYGGGGGLGGAIYSSGTLTCRSSQLTNNTTGFGGDGYDGGGSGGSGGAIYCDGEWTIQSCKISDNWTGQGGIAFWMGRGGDGGNGGGICSYNTTMSVALTIENSTLSDNRTGQGGFSSSNAGGNGGNGGGIYSYNTVTGVTLTIKNSTLVGGTAGNAGNGYGLFQNGGNGGGGGCIYSGGTSIALIIQHSTLSGGVTGSGGNIISTMSRGAGGNGGSGGGICFNSAGTILVQNSTVSSNRTGGGGNGGGSDLNYYGPAGNGGNGGVGGGISSTNAGATLTIHNSTLTLNSTGNGGTPGFSGAGLGIVGSNGSGGGIYNSGYFNLTNSIVAGNTTANYTNIFGPFVGANNLTNGNPLLSPLGNYGGPTQTMPPLPGSPAIDAGNDSVTNNLATDQRGLPRLIGLHVDIGAAEAQLIFLTQPQSITSSAGTTATFAVTGAGAPPLAYQWRKNGNPLADGGNVSGSASNILTLSNVQLSDAANYTVVITNLYGSVTSSVATLTVVSPPSIAQDPQSAFAQCGTGSANFSVTTTGTGPLSYQWRCNDAPIPGATTTNYTVNPTTLTNAGNYTVVVTNRYGSITSSIATLTLTNQTLTVANTDALNAYRNLALTIYPALLTSNDVPGSCNGSKTNLTIISVSPVSTNGGAVAFFPAGQPLWTNSYDGPGSGEDRAWALTVDVSGIVYVCGVSYSNFNGRSFTTIAYLNTGYPLWTNRYAGPGDDDDPLALAADCNGNVFVTGVSLGDGTYYDWATVAYDKNGLALWTNRFIGPNSYGNDWPYGLAVDTTSNVYVTGFSEETNGAYDCLTIAYSGSGVPLWTNRYQASESANSTGNAVAVDANGQVYVTGWTGGPGGNGNYLTLAYSSVGQPLWTNQYDGPVNGGDSASAIALDRAGQVYVTGSSSGNNSSSDFATIAYSSEGHPLWTNRYNGPAHGNDEARRIAVGQDGKVFVTGYSDGGSGTGFIDYATVAYSSNGVGLWTNRYNGPAHDNDYGRDVAVGGSGTVYVTGASTLSYSVGSSLTIAYSETGVPVWTNGFIVPAGGSSWADALALDQSGNVFITGTHVDGGSGNYDFATLKYSGGNVVYTPPTNFTGTDSFTYVVMDSLGQTATSTVTLAVSPLPPPTTSQAPRVANGNFVAHFSGVPGGTYQIEFLTDFTSGWQPFTTVIASPTGDIAFSTPVTVAPMRFFRVIPAS